MVYDLYINKVENPRKLCGPMYMCGYMRQCICIGVLANISYHRAETIPRTGDRRNRGERERRRDRERRREPARETPSIRDTNLYKTEKQKRRRDQCHCEQPFNKQHIIYI